MYLPGIWVYQASERCETQRKETPILTKREVRIINLGLLHSITAPVAMPEARPCRARLVLVFSLLFLSKDILKISSKAGEIVAVLKKEII